MQPKQRNRMTSCLAAATVVALAGVMFTVGTTSATAANPNCANPPRRATLRRPEPRQRERGRHHHAEQQRRTRRRRGSHSGGCDHVRITDHVWQHGDIQPDTNGPRQLPLVLLTALRRCYGERVGAREVALGLGRDQLQSSTNSAAVPGRQLRGTLPDRYPGRSDSEHQRCRRHHRLRRCHPASRPQGSQDQEVHQDSRVSRTSALGPRPIHRPPSTQVDGGRCMPGGGRLTGQGMC